MCDIANNQVIINGKYFAVNPMVGEALIAYSNNVTELEHQLAEVVADHGETKDELDKERTAVRALTAEIKRLKTKLEEIHNTDRKFAWAIANEALKGGGK